jgi:UDP-N-acetylmuramate dehydrogenase
MTKNVSMRTLNTLALEAVAEELIHVTAMDQFEKFLPEMSQRPIEILGGGSNVILERTVPGLVLVIALKGRTLCADDGRRAVLRIGAGENWHDLVVWCHHQGLHGLANLALIPGSVGAAPIQNIGAYGVEVADRIRRVHVVDRWTGERTVLSSGDCDFGYRDSLFKRPEGAKWIITQVELELDREAPVEASYPLLSQRLADAELTHDAVLAAVISIRRERLPDPIVTPNVGSFFKNPIVSGHECDVLRQQAPEVPAFPMPGGAFKIPAAWLIDQLGWRGVERRGVKVSEGHALVLVGAGALTAEPWLALAGEIAASVADRFGVNLQLEPRVLGAPAKVG